MRRSVAERHVTSPQGLNEALGFLAEHAPQAWKPLAGGTDALVPSYRDGRSKNSHWMSMHRLRKELRYIHETDDQFVIGAMATIQDLFEHDGLARSFGTIREACRSFAGPAIRNRATVAGNIANASPAADLPPVWLILDAQLELASVRGRRLVPVENFWTGYKCNSMEHDELIVALIVTKTRDQETLRSFRKVSPRRTDSISLLNFSASGIRGSNGSWRDIRLAFGCMGPFALRARLTEEFIEGRCFDASKSEELAQSLSSELKPLSDHRATAAYRLRTATRLTNAFLAGSLTG